MMTKMTYLLLVAALAAPLGVAAGVTVDAQGWTKITPSADSRVIYVSSSGNDSNDGFSPSQPKRTIAGANQVVRDGYPDHIRLKRGDTFTIGSGGLGRWKNGRSATEPIVITYYGDSGPRPVIEVTNILIHHASGVRNYQAFVGLDIYKPSSDPAAGSKFTNAQSTVAIEVTGGGANILIEDCRFRFVSVVAQSANGGVYTNFKFRRNIVLDSWLHNSSTTDDHINGIYVSGIDGYILEENFFDHCGWSETISGAGANMYAHNMYVQYSNKAGGIIRGNISARSAAHGCQARAGGVVERNLFVLNAIGANIGGMASPTDPAVMQFDNRFVENVILNGRRMDPNDGSAPRTTAVWGFAVAYVGEVDAIDNIIANRIHSGNNRAFLTDQQPASLQLVDNIVRQWDPVYDMTDPSWPHPDHDLGDYYASIGGTNSTVAYLNWLRERPLGVLPWDMTAYAAINYIREGFNKDEVAGYFDYPDGPDPDPTGTNVALGKSLTVSAFESGSTNNGAKLVDGNTNATVSRWSAFGYSQWAVIDLGAVYDLSQIKVHPYQNRAYRYTIATGTAPGSYTTVVNRSNNTTVGAVLSDDVSVSARYVRINVTGAFGYTGNWVSIGELEVIGVP